MSRWNYQWLLSSVILSYPYFPGNGPPLTHCYLIACMALVISSESAQACRNWRSLRGLDLTQTHYLLPEEVSPDLLLHFWTLCNLSYYPSNSTSICHMWPTISKVTSSFLTTHVILSLLYLFLSISLLVILTSQVIEMVQSYAIQTWNLSRLQYPSGHYSAHSPSAILSHFFPISSYPWSSDLYLL